MPDTVPSLARPITPSPHSLRCSGREEPVLRPTANGAQRASRHPIFRLVAGMIVLLALLGLQFTVVAPAAAAVPPKVAIIVGPSGSLTATNLSWGRAAAAEARHYTSNVVTVYTPSATWARVKAAMTDASVVVYIGKGRG